MTRTSYRPNRPISPSRRALRLALPLMLALGAVGAQASMPVFVSIPPQKTFVERVGGEHVDVSTMVRPGHSPRTYEPAARQMVAVSKARAYFRIGVAFERAWMDRLIEANPGMRVVDLRQGIALRAMGHPTHDAHADEGREDPHIWTDPGNVALMAKTIRDTLIDLDPTHRAAYESNYRAFAAELGALDREIRTMLKGIDRRRFMVFHPAWGYFADAYGLAQIPIEVEGKEPGPRTLSRIIERAKTEDIDVVFVQEQYSRRNAQTVAQAIGARVVALDPLAEDYISNLRHVAQQIAGALH